MNKFKVKEANVNLGIQNLQNEMKTSFLITQESETTFALFDILYVNYV